MLYKYCFVVTEPDGCSLVQVVHTYVRSLVEACEVASLYAAEYGCIVQKVEQCFDQGSPIAIRYLRG